MPNLIASNHLKVDDLGGGHGPAAAADQNPGDGLRERLAAAASAPAACIPALGEHDYPALP